MPARKNQDTSINLLPQKNFEASTAGRVLSWILSTFRIIVIITEIIVMLAFLSRFWFDAQNSNLDEKIQQKRAILQAQKDFEQNFRDTQNRLAVYSKITNPGVLQNTLLTDIKNYLPQDVIVTQIVTQGEKVSISAITPNETSIKQYVVNLIAIPALKDVILVSTASTLENPSIFLFNITATINKQ